MPNQLCADKSRRSFIEDKALLDALDEVARSESRSSASLIRDALRGYLRDRTQSEDVARVVRKVIRDHKPAMPTVMKTPAAVSRFKAAQRRHDALALALGVETPEEIQARNSVYAPTAKVRVLNFASAHKAR